MTSSDPRACCNGGDDPHPLQILFTATGPGEVNEHFEVPLHSNGGLGVTTTALARRLAWLDAQGGQHNVYLSSPRLRWYYTQALVDPADGVWIEAVSNEFIGPVEAQLSDDEEQLLAELGFHEPDVDGSPNHWCVLAAPVDWAEAAALLTTPLVLVYGLTDLDDLVVEICPHGRYG